MPDYVIMSKPVVRSAPVSENDDPSDDGTSNKGKPSEEKLLENKPSEDKPSDGKLAEENTTKDKPSEPKRLKTDTSADHSLEDETSCEDERPELEPSQNGKS